MPKQYACMAEGCNQVFDKWNRARRHMYSECGYKGQMDSEDSANKAARAQNLSWANQVGRIPTPTMPKAYACLVDGCNRLFGKWSGALTHMKACGYEGIKPNQQDSARKAHRLMSKDPDLAAAMAAVPGTRPPKPPKSQALSNRLVLADRFRPRSEIEIHLAPVAARWVCHNGGGGIKPDGSPAPTVDAMSPVVASLAETFIPRVQCHCGQDMHGQIYYKPATTHRLGPPDLLFALRNDASASQDFPAADLDETTSIAEYSSTFRGAIRAEHEERMRLYEQFSMYKRSLRRLDQRRMAQHDKASIPIDGIADARPSLAPGDTVLLRPIQPLVHLVRGWRGQTEAHPYTVEIESRILNIVRGNQSRPDQVIISWNLTLEQKDALKDHSWVREYAIRFIPQSTAVERCLTALDWLDSLSEPQQQALKDILFPIAGPTVKPLSPQQRQVMRGVPTAEDYSAKTDISDIGKPLNELQSSFVRMVRARTQDPSYERTRPPCILTGPAGTGKTKTLIYAIADVLGLLQQGPQSQSQTNTNRVLICCPSHAACDVLTRRLKGLLNRREIFRMYDHSRPISTVPGDIIQFTCQLPGSDRFTLPPPAVWTGLRAVVCTCLDTHLLFRSQITNDAVRAKQHCFQKFLLSGSHPLGLRLGQVERDENPYFTHLFIDEAAQATEPEILCPISCVVDQHLSGRKVEIALVGDPRQLSPKVYANSVQDSLGRSFMERLLRRPVTCVGGGEESLLGPTEHNSLLDNTSSLSDLIRYYHSVDGQEQLTVFLTENYRGHPSMLMMPSSFFYFDRLRTAKSMDSESLIFWIEKLRQVESLSFPVKVAIEPSGASGGEASLLDTFGQVDKQATWPIHFCGVKGDDSSIALQTFSGTDSWANVKEAQATVGIITELIENGVHPKRIGAMTPFRGQVVTIRKLLREKHFHDVNVGTVENYQAVEQDVIVLSLTRSEREFVPHDIEKRMGILGQPKRANVAMTRAESLFIVVGNPDTMWMDKCWRHWLRFCFRNGLWYGQGLEQWKKVERISFRGMDVVSTVDLSDEDQGKSELVVSTLEKIQRVQSPRSALSW